MTSPLRRRLERLFLFSAVLFSLGATVSMAVVAGYGLGWDQVCADWLLRAFE